MPCRHVIDAAAGLAYHYLHGTVTGTEINAAFRTYLDDPAWRPHYAVLWDALNVTALIVEWEEMERFRVIAAAMEERLGPGRTVIVARRDLDRTMATNYQLFTARAERAAKGREQRVFTDLPEATAWLGVPTETVDRLRRAMGGEP